MRLLILGANGLLGNSLFQFFNSESSFEVFGTVRSLQSDASSNQEKSDRLITGIDILDPAKMKSVFIEYKPDLVINCTGLTKHRDEGGNHLKAIALNSLVPHQLAELCERSNARLIHFSTDCVFTGQKGLYKETDFADAGDVYGRSKLLGEVDYSHAVTMRTSMIGPELSTAYGLLEWFLLQKDHCRGFSKAIFSGLPTVELARIIKDHVLPNETLSGVYHVAAQPISKYDLLKLIAKIYGKEIEISPDDKLVIDRSLSGARFQKDTGYIAPSWPKLIKDMYENHKKRDL